MRRNFAGPIGAIKDFVVNAELHAGINCGSAAFRRCRRHFWLHALSDNALDHGGEAIGTIPNQGTILLQKRKYSLAFAWLRSQYLTYNANHDPSLEDPGFYRLIENALAAAEHNHFSQAFALLEQCKRISSTAPDIYFIEGAISLARHDHLGEKRAWLEGIARFNYGAGIPPRYGNGWSLSSVSMLLSAN